MQQIKPKSKTIAAAKLNDLLQRTVSPEVQALLLQALDMLCDAHGIEIPEDAVAANISLDDHFGCDVLSMR